MVPSAEVSGPGLREGGRKAVGARTLASGQGREAADSAVREWREDPDSSGAVWGSLDPKAEGGGVWQP